MTDSGQSVSRALLESDEAFREAEDVLIDFFGEPPREEEWADVYGGIVDAVLTKLATLQPITHGRHCACSACVAEDWSNPALAPCGMHGPSCPGRSVFGNVGSLAPR